MAEKEWPIAYPLETDAAVNEMSLGGYNPNTLKEGVHQRRFSFSYLKSFFQGTLPSRVTDVEDIVKNIEIENIATLRLTVGSYHGQIAIVQGYYNSGDGGGGPIRYWDSASTATDNGGSVIKPTSVFGAGRWLWSYSGPINVKWFGAKGDGVTDDTAAIQAPMDLIRNEVGGVYGGVVILPTDDNEIYRIDSDLIIQSGVTLTTQMYNTDMANSTTIDKLSGKILLNPSATIELRINSSLQGVCIIPQGMTFPQYTADIALWTGTAITIVGDCTRIESVTIVGFERAIDWNTTTFPGGGRHRWNNVLIDCLNGVRQGRNLDACYFDNIHGWPLATSGGSPTIPTDILRPGIFWEVIEISDFQYWTNCFCFGYETAGWSFEAETSGAMTGCGVDGYNTGLGLGPYTPTSKGIDISYPSIRIIGCSFSQQKNGVYIDITLKTNPKIILNGSSFFNNENDINIATGSAIINGCRLVSGDNGIIIAGSTEADNIIIEGNSFSGHTSYGIYNQNNAAKSLISIGKNIYESIGVKPVFTADYKSIASADPLPLNTASDTMTITGTVTINSFSTLGEWPGREITLLFGGVLTITHSASLVLKSGANIVTSAGNIVKFVCTGDGVWREVSRNF